MYQLSKVSLRLAGFYVYALFIVLFSFIILPAKGENVKDTRLLNLRDPDHFKLRLKPVHSLKQWEERKTQLRETLLIKTGLWPEPVKTPLNAKIFDERKGDGFTVAKVYFESLPGFLATGNLYRPTSGTGPYPAIITPHGHWEYGRLQNSAAGSIPGRCIDFTRQGFVVFSIDMIGYNDSFQLPHDPYKSRAQMKADIPEPYEPRLFRGDFDFPEAKLYGFNLGGLHLWNNIRGVDFLTSLPYVDSQRIGATGASGGASQTLFLMIADERIKVAAPVNIIGAEKHPGCRCENIPEIWIDMSTIELCAAFAPRPLLLMSATKDPWTHSTPEREYPLIKKYYSLYDADNMIKNVHIDAGHNYNAETRAAVYEWFCSHLKSQFPLIEKPSQIAEELDELGDLRVFPDRILPENALTGREIIQNWKHESEKKFVESIPHSRSQLDEFSENYRRMLKRILVLNDSFQGEMSLQVIKRETVGELTFQKALLLNNGEEAGFEIESLYPENVSKGNLLLVYPDNDGGFFLPDSRECKFRVNKLIQKGYRLHRIRGYASGHYAIPVKIWDSLNWPSAYNRDNCLNGIHDIVVAMSYIRDTWRDDSLTVVGLKECGLITAFACAASGIADKVVIDMNLTDPGYDGELVRLFPVGGIKKAGDFRTASILLMQKPFVLFNAGPTFDSDWIARKAEQIGCSQNIHSGLSIKNLNYADVID